MDDEYWKEYVIRKDLKRKRDELDVTLKEWMIRRALERRIEAEEERKRKLEDAETLEQWVANPVCRRRFHYEMGVNVTNTRLGMPRIVEEEIAKLVKELKSDRGSEEGGKATEGGTPEALARLAEGNGRPPGGTLRLVRGAEEPPETRSRPGTSLSG